MRLSLCSSMAFGAWLGGCATAGITPAGAEPPPPSGSSQTKAGQGSPSAKPLEEMVVDDKAAQTQTRGDKVLSDGMAATLRKAGFTELQILPNSILVRAKDKAGNPVAMILNPGSMTEVVTLDPQSGSAAGGNGARAPLTGSGTYVTVLPSEKLASVLVGMKVRGTNNEDLATIKDLAIDHGGLHAYILVVGGMLGIGDRYVAVAPSTITLTYDQVANTYAATMKASADQLKSAPEFTYEGAFKAGRQ